MKDIQIQANLSVERSGGTENLKKVIEETDKILKNKFPEAEITVRKGFFQTIDGIWSNDPEAEYETRQAVTEARQKVLKK